MSGVINQKSVTVVDYGVGNLLSVKRGFEEVGARVLITSDRNEVLAAERLVLPGVGAFPNAMISLQNLDLISAIREFSLANKPLLAICLGMQLLMDESEEFGLTKGLGLISGKVVPIPNSVLTDSAQKIPFVGWSEILCKTTGHSWGESPLKENVPGEFVYFTHSFMAQPTYLSNIAAITKYGDQEITAVVIKDKIMGCQFHPEKSGSVGLKILRQFSLQ